MTDDRPVYLQIADELRARIVSGDLVDGDRLPSIPALTRDRGVSSKTAHDALKVLIAEGLATSRSGSGTYVRRLPKQQKLLRAWYRNTPYGGSPFRQDMEAQGRQAGWSYESRTVIAPRDIRDRLALPEEGAVEDVVRTDYVFTADGEPVMLSTSYEPMAITRGTAAVLPEDGELAGQGVVERMMRIGYPVDDWVEEVGARLGTADECQRLSHAPGSVMVTIQRTYYSGELAVETADIVVPADRFALVYSGKMGRAQD
ncbi:GntR family transcriptional regulator [Nonomuraea dietziae]|uniref:GntR family transcriptional regulator n=1 Tax=Nonomuraea dietziae TaxID=65515 RepID=UPI0034392CD1